MEDQDAIDVWEAAFGVMLCDHLRGRAGGAILEVDGGPSPMGADRRHDVDRRWIDTSTSHIGFRCVVRNGT
jgi:hypothetical protein